ncbi:MAG: CBS domain-containing protein [Candidatus Binatia bacterium]
MQLREFVNSRVETIQSTDTLEQAAAKMREIDVGSLPVCDGDQLIGMITDRDITIRAVAGGNEPAVATVGEVMTPEVLWCFEDEEVEEAARIMQEHQVRRILVLNQAKELVGITSLGELATATGNRLLAGETLESVSASTEFQRTQEEDERDEETSDDAEAGGDSELSRETRVTGLLNGRDDAKKVIAELKGAGFADSSIVLAMKDEVEQARLVDEAKVQLVAEQEIPSLPDLSSGQVLIMVEAEERAEDALNILNRNKAVTGGVRIPAA